MDWGDWLKNDRVLLILLILVFLNYWAFTGEAKLLEAMVLVLGVLFGIVRGEYRVKNGNGGSDANGSRNHSGQQGS